MIPARIALTVGVMLLTILGLGRATVVGAEREWAGSVQARSLNVPAGPGEGHAIIGKLQRGEKIVAVDQVGRWVRLKAEEPTYVHRRWVNLPDNFMAPAFSDAENKFLDWVEERGDLQQLSVDVDGRLSIVLADQTAVTDAAAGVAAEIGCAFRDQTRFDGEVTVTVWPAAGPENGWIAQSTCP